MTRVIEHHAPFDLRNQNHYFGGWPVLVDTPERYQLVMAFPVDGWKGSVAVALTQTAAGQLTAEAFGTADGAVAIRQALSVLSLDGDEADWTGVGQRDQVIGELQHKYQFLRPVLFHSPYEAAAGFVIGQRVSVKQRQMLQQQLADQFGDKITIEGRKFAAFPIPQGLVQITSFPGLSEIKIGRLHGVARAALAGQLDRARLRAMPIETVLTELQAIDGIGPFYAQGILFRGAGIVDEITDDNLTKHACQRAYKLTHLPSQAELIHIAERWRPYRMWCEVLLHVWLRRESACLNVIDDHDAIRRQSL
ncbi:MAG: DNA-3-methyladenine glycosylase 2 family protein [Ignavibacteriae bacterium]|nr:DNA-3-methyladenine glycosylase 2 family protein [Ignavibacteriota bacterium]